MNFYLVFKVQELKGKRYLINSQRLNDWLEHPVYLYPFLGVLKYR